MPFLIERGPALCAVGDAISLGGPRWGPIFHFLNMRFLNGSMTGSAGRQLAGGVSRCIVRYIPVIIRLGHLPHFPASGLAA